LTDLVIIQRRGATIVGMAFLAVRSLPAWLARSGRFVSGFLIAG
jgi:hypothetical protein